MLVLEGQVDEPWFESKGWKVLGEEIERFDKNNIHQMNTRISRPGSRKIEDKDTSKPEEANPQRVSATIGIWEGE